MSKAIEVNSSNFDQTVKKSSTPVLVDFWAPWCKPCTMVSPILDELADEYSGRVTFAKVNVDDNSQIATSYNVMSIPTMIIFKDGEPVSNITGFKPKAQLKEELDTVLS